MSQTLHAPSPMTRAMELAADQANIISRRQLYGLGVTRSQLRAQLVARRWRRCLSQSISITTGPLTVEARRWVAVFEGGPRGFLDGSAALLAAGLEGFTATPSGSRCRAGREYGGPPGSTSGRLVDGRPTMSRPGPGHLEHALRWRPCALPCGRSRRNRPRSW